MKNVTLAIDEELLASARTLAERRKTSLNALVRSLLAHEVEQEDRIAWARAGIRQLIEESTLEFEPGTNVKELSRRYAQMSFMDTNILIWAADRKPDDPRKAAISRELVLGNVFGVSAQSVAEFVNAASRARVVLPGDQIERWIGFLSSMPFTVLDAALVRRGFWLCQRYRVQYYDAALLAAAERLGAPLFYSEDLNHGQTYGSVRVVNPFLSRRLTFKESRKTQCPFSSTRTPRSSSRG